MECLPGTIYETTTRKIVSTSCRNRLNIHETISDVRRESPSVRNQGPIHLHLRRILPATLHAPPRPSLTSLLVARHTPLTSRYHTICLLGATFFAIFSGLGIVADLSCLSSFPSLPTHSTHPLTLPLSEKPPHPATSFIPQSRSPGRRISSAGFHRVGSGGEDRPSYRTPIACFSMKRLVIAIPFPLQQEQDKEDGRLAD